ncbi:cadherin-1-like [Mobula birostris]|uniref:cadherin-1-like n=1 Tax=Mobula birostris TaxID=1983395 RepID=UPI003B28978B
MSSFTFCCLGILAFLLQVCSGEGSQRCEGFDKDSYVFEVESLAVGQVLGRVHFNCSEPNGLEFHTDDPSFQVESDGRVLVSDIPSTNQTSFIIVAFSKAEDTWRTVVTVLVNGDKVKGSAEDKSDVPVFMWPSQFSHSVLRRRKRDWVIPVIKHPENERGPFPKFLAQIKSDRQEETRVFYTITGPGADQPPVGVFTINRNNGIIYVHKPSDREERDKYKLLAHALDENGVQLEDAVDVVIEVIDMNDNKPQFVDPTFYGRVVEGATPGTAFMNVTATDADEKDNSNSILKYSIDSQDPANPNSQMFTISSTSGLISVLHAGLDREKMDKYTLIVRAADLEGEGLMTTATAIITITDANDNAPKFVTSSITVEVPENEVDYDVSRHPVTDDDLPYTPAWKANFSITFGNERNQFTMITDPQNNGVLRIAKPLDFEKSKQHVVIIEVKNEIPFTVTMPLSSATVTINVHDVNEAPIFNPETKTEKQPENLPVGSTVTTCKAKDPDTAQEQTIRYRMGSDPANWFDIEAETGIVKLISLMDRESEFVKDSIYIATVLASDNGSPPATGTGTILLQLEDINDNPPIATTLINCVCSEDPVPVNVTIIDKDIPPNTSPFVVMLVHGAERNWTIESTENSHVKLLKLRNKIEPNTYEVPLKVTDGGTPQLSQVTGLRVEVCDCEHGACSQKIAARAFGFLDSLAILGAILALFILVFLLLLYIRKKRSVNEKSFLPKEDIGDNIYQNDEEGGGEEDKTKITTN